MALKPITEDQINQSAQRKELRLDEPEPPPENILALLELGVDVEVTIGGRKYTAPPTPFKAGIRLEQLYNEIQEYRSYGPKWRLDAPYERKITEIKSIIWNLLVPVSRFEKFLKATGLKRTLPDSMSDADIGRLLGFFRLFRMKSNIRFSFQQTAEAGSEEA